MTSGAIDYLRHHDPFIRGFRDDPDWRVVLQEAQERHRELEAHLVAVPRGEESAQERIDR